nr:hypothetical protein BaRGS_003328 [Batillaria attramentaria]
MYDTPRHKELIKELEWLKKLPEKSNVKQPAYILWYFYLLAPVLSYSAAILLTRFMTAYHALIFFPAVAGDMWLLKGSGHRLNHVSRWPNPVFAGTFVAGMLHTMLAYMIVVRPHMVEHPLFVWMSYVLAVVILVLFYKLVTVDPGTATQSAQDKVTGKILTILDVGREERKWEEFCVDCEIVKPKFTKHCRLCERCMAGMDHHCLFLLKCVASRNHSLFVWFILCCMTCMIMFLYSVYVYRYRAYAGLSLTETLLEMLAVDAWVLSLVLLNMMSVFWAWSLLMYQCRLIQNGYTAYFQPEFKGDVLTDYEKFMNMLYFLANRRPHIVNPCIDV